MTMTNSMRRVWMGISLSVAMLTFFPAWNGMTSWWTTGIALTVFGIFLIEPWFLTWELRRRGEALQITDEGVLRRLARGDSEFVRWSELREVSIVVTQGVNLSDEYLFVLSGSPVLRDPDGEHELAEGDLVCFPEGPDGAHKVTNRTEEPVRILMLSTKAKTAMAVYPDSNKVGVWPLGKLFRIEDAVEYYDGEL